MSSRNRKRAKPAGHCPPEDVLQRPKMLDEVARSYILNVRRIALEELKTFADEPNLAAAVRRAGLAQNECGKRFPHQYRIPGDVLKRAARRLGRVVVRRSQSFDDLHELVWRTIGPIAGIGELMIYDTALRIGAKMGVAPTRVYLHAGTRVGARHLGLGRRAQFLEKSDFPAALRALEPREIEDCLCIYADALSRIGRRSSR